MAKKKSKDALKRREAKRHRKLVLRKEQVRAANRHIRLTRSSEAFSIGVSMPPKLSAVILEYAKPLTDATEDKSGREKAIQLAIVFWNASTLPLENAREKLLPALEKLVDGDQELKKELLEMFAMMYARKQLYYRQDKRLIVDHSLTDNGESLYLQVMSTPMAA